MDPKRARSFTDTHANGRKTAKTAKKDASDDAKISQERSERSKKAQQTKKHDFEAERDYICIPEPGGSQKEEQKVLAYKPASEVPGHSWIFSKKAVYWFNEWMRECAIRDPDNFDMYIYKRYHVYGICEVIENQLKFLHHELGEKKNPDLIRLWTHLQGIAIWLIIGDADLLNSHDDSDAVSDIFTAYGTANANAELVENQPWIPVVLEMAEEAGLSLDKAWPTKGHPRQWLQHVDLDETLKEAEPSESEHKLWKEEPWAAPLSPIFREAKDWRNPSWAEFWKVFVEWNQKTGVPGDGLALGGANYDLTKMDKFEKAQYSLLGPTSSDGFEDDMGGFDSWETDESNSESTTED